MGGPVVQALPVVHVTGYPADAPEAARLVEAFKQPLRNFYLRATQASALNQLPHSRFRVDRGDHQMEYLINQGQERVVLTVHPTRARQVLEEKPPEKPRKQYPLWALIEFELDFPASEDVTYSAEMLARIGTRIEARSNTTTALPGAPEDIRYLAFGGGVHSAARAVVAPGSSTDPYRFSLLVDLKPFIPQEGVARPVLVDVFAKYKELHHQQRGWRAEYDTSVADETFWDTPTPTASVLEAIYTAEFAAAYAHLEYASIVNMMYWATYPDRPLVFDNDSLIPLPDPIVTYTAATAASPGTSTTVAGLMDIRNIDVDPTSGLITHYRFAGFYSPDPGTIVLRGPDDVYWNIVPTYEDVPTPKPLTTPVTGMLIYSDPRWVAHATELAPHKQLIAEQYRWAPRSDTDLTAVSRTNLRPAVWAASADDLGTPGTKIGVITCDLEARSVSFKPA